MDFSLPQGEVEDHGANPAKRFYTAHTLPVLEKRVPPPTACGGQPCPAHPLRSLRVEPLAPRVRWGPEQGEGEGQGPLLPSQVTCEKKRSWRLGVMGVRHVAEYLGTLRFSLVSQGKAFPSDLRASGACLQPH